MTPTGTSFPWTEISPGHFRQPLDSFGRLWSTWCHTDLQLGREPVSIASYVKFNTGLEVGELQNSLRDAWRTIRYYNPGIACTVDQFYREYKKPSEVEVTHWVSETFKTHLHKTADEVVRDHAKVFHPVLHFIPARNGQQGGELVLLSNHFFNDGRGEFYLWNAFFELITTPKAVTFGDESKYLPKARDDLLGLPPSPSIPGYAKAMSVVGSSYAPDPVRTPMMKEKGTDCGCLKRLTLSKSQTARLVSACKLKGVSVTGAFKAARILTLRSLEEASDGYAKDECLGLEMIDLRTAFKGSYSPYQGFGTDYHVVLPAKFDLGHDKTFLDTAENMTTWLHTTRDQFTKDPEGLDAVGYVTMHSLTTPTDAPIPPVFSSLGIVDEFMRSTYRDGMVDIEDTWMAVPANAGTYNGLWVWTWRGQLNLLTSFNQGYYSLEMMERSLSAIVDAVLEGLEID